MTTGKRKLTRQQKRSLQVAALAVFVRKYGRKAQRGVEPNDRRYDRKVARAIKQMRPEVLDALLRDDG